MVIDWLYIKIAGKVDKEFVIKAKAEQIILEIIIVDGTDSVDEVDEPNRINIYREIALL